MLILFLLGLAAPPPPAGAAILVTPPPAAWRLSGAARGGLEAAVEETGRKPVSLTAFEMALQADGLRALRALRHQPAPPAEYDEALYARLKPGYDRCLAASGGRPDPRFQACTAAVDDALRQQARAAAGASFELAAFVDPDAPRLVVTLRWLHDDLVEGSQRAAPLPARPSAGQVAKLAHRLARALLSAK